MTPHPRSRICARKQLRDLPLGRTIPYEVPDFVGNFMQFRVILGDFEAKTQEKETALI